MAVSIHLYLLGSGRVSQGKAISGSCQQALVGICLSVWLWWFYMGWIPRWGSFSMLIPSVSTPHCLCNSFHGYFVPHSKKDRSIHTLVFLLLEFHVACELCLGYSDLLGYYPLISECISCVFFCDWVTLLKMILSSSIHLPKNFMNSLFLIAE
jgi:hypothetical protein